MGIVTAVRGLARYDGLSRLPRAAVMALKPLRFHIYLVVESEMPNLGVPDGFSFHADALDWLRKHREGRNDLPNEFWRDQVNGAGHCWIAEHDGEIAAVSWTHSYPDKRPILALAPGDAEGTATYVLPDFRGRGLFRSLSVFGSRRWLATRGGRLFAVAASNNPISPSQIPRMGYVEVATLHRPSLIGPKFRTANVKTHQ